jgi:predicted DNA-binding transcriptional regulator AlpA
MRNRTTVGADGLGERLITAEEVADLLGVSRRKVLLLPIKQIRIGPRIIRYRLEDVLCFLAIENPTP